MTGVKRSSSNHGHKSSAKRSYLSDSQSSITHTGSPVNPMTAKALASKLNERNNLLNGTKKGANTHSTSTSTMIGNNSSVNDIPIPPLISIQTSSTPNRFKDGQIELTMHQPKLTHSKNFHSQTDGNGKPDVKHQKSNMSSKHHNGSNSVKVIFTSLSNCFNEDSLIKFVLFFFKRLRIVKCIPHPNNTNAIFVRRNSAR